MNSLPDLRTQFFYGNAKVRELVSSGRRGEVKFPLEIKVETIDEMTGHTSPSGRLPVLPRERVKMELPTIGVAHKRHFFGVRTPGGNVQRTLTAVQEGHCFDRPAVHRHQPEHYPLIVWV